MKENAYNALVARETRMIGAQVLNKWGNSREGRGWPDLYVAHRTWTGWLELKVDRGSLSDAQEDRIKGLRDNDAPVWVLRLVDRVEYCEEVVWHGGVRLMSSRAWTAPYLIEGGARSVRAAERLRWLASLEQLR